MDTRFTATAAATFRTAVLEAGGVEVFAIGDVAEGRVSAVAVVCRGSADSVPALLERPRAGQVVIHNHPSGNLSPSNADLQLAALYGDAGVGVVIVDSAVSRAHWVVEPFEKKVVPIDRDRLDRFFREDLARVIPGYEARDAQLRMAHGVADALDQARPFLCEAGTGTGKSLAYLVPGALWAMANDGKVAVSTFTRTLQVQLVRTDIPMLRRGGIDARTAVLEGRNNYVCKRRLGAASTEALLQVDHEDPGKRELAAHLLRLAEWESGTGRGSRSELPFSVPEEAWEQVESDSDLTLRMRCPHYQECHFYQARREAAAAHVLVVNHALLLADLAVRAENDRGVLPKFDRVILDEGHHLEDAATGATSRRVTARAVRRAVQPALPGRRNGGALLDLPASHPQLTPSERTKLITAAAEAVAVVSEATEASEQVFATLAEQLSPTDPTRRFTAEYLKTSDYSLTTIPLLRSLSHAFDEAVSALDTVLGPFEEVSVPEDKAQALLDTRRARRRLGSHAQTVRDVIDGSTPDVCRWLHLAAVGRQEAPSAALSLAPIDVGDTLAKILWNAVPGAVATSATLSINGDFGFWRDRVGLGEAHEDVLPSPFNHFDQAVLAIPRDLPPPDAPGFAEASADAVVEAVRASRGGAFVLCTSYEAVERYGRALEQAFGARVPVLVQGRGGRGAMLDKFRENRHSILIGTDSFWEGVSVKGDALRLVIIPRLPFRVPNEPLQVARQERIAQHGGDPFRSFSLPQATIKLRQGYGRLIRSATDRGVVLILDRRIVEKSYGATMLDALPPARRWIGLWSEVLPDLRRYFST
jgi:ATP-dependent DNA helicase DinG